MQLSSQASEQQLSLLRISQHYVEHNYQEDISNDISGYGGGLYISSSSGEEFLSFSGTFRIGLHAWDKSGSTSILDNSSAFSADFYNDGVGAYAGFGLSLGLTENLAADISYDIIGVNNIVSFENGSSIASIGLKYNF